MTRFGCPDTQQCSPDLGMGARDGANDGLVVLTVKRVLHRR
jgi:hypothetical protein